MLTFLKALTCFDRRCWVFNGVFCYDRDVENRNMTLFTRYWRWYRRKASTDFRCVYCMVAAPLEDEFAFLDFKISCFVRIVGF